MENDDAKYISGLSAILVATIEEAKDRISQIEYIFCSQLYPNFQSRLKSLQKTYLEAEKQAEDTWKEKEKNLLLRIEKLELEKQEAQEENQSLKLEKDQLLRMPEDKANSLAATVRTQKIKIDDLEGKLVGKCKEVDEGMDLQSKLLELIQTKSNLIVEKGKQLKEHEEKANGMVARVRVLEKEVEELQEELRRKSERQTDLEKSFNKRVDGLLSMVANYSTASTDHEKEIKEFTYKLGGLEENISELREKLREKTIEFEEGKVKQAKLLQQIEVTGMEILKQKQMLDLSENEKKLLLEKVNSLEERINGLQQNPSSRSKVEGKDSYETLYQKLMVQRKKSRETFNAYKRLKSAYNFLLSKSGLASENMVTLDKFEDVTGSLNPATSLDIEGKNSDSLKADCEMIAVKTENESSDGSEDDKVTKSIPASGFQYPTSGYIAPKLPSTSKSGSITGRKRPASSWIDTRSHHCKDGPDPHDDFLDTPLEKLRENWSKATKEGVHDHNVSLQKDMKPDSLDDETQDVVVDPCQQDRQILEPMADKKGFKYVEPVRKKAERENLKGVECKQCKKFYDAVLPEDGGRYSNGDKFNLRCEHHDGVSRHRYKHIPPMTPEGFWNIGFESEM